MRVGADVVSVMAVYSDLVCVCMVHCAKSVNRRCHLANKMGEGAKSTMCIRKFILRKGRVKMIGKVRLNAGLSFSFVLTLPK